MGDVEIYIDGELRQTISLQSQNAEYQQKVYEVSDLNEGIHTIKGVKKNGSKLAVDYFKVLGEIERPAEEKTFTTKFIVDGKETVIVTPEGEQIQMPADPQKEGYTFTGWYTAVNGGEKVTEFITDQTVYAQWKKNEDEKPVSKKTLEYFLNKAKEHVANGDVDGLVESVKKLFEEAIAEGEAVMENDAATKEEVTNATVKLMKAIHALDFVVGDKTDLEMAMELAEMIDLQKYVEAGKAEFNTAKNQAESVLANGDAMQDEVDDAWSALIEAIDNLRLKANKEALKELIESLEGLNLDIYTEESVKAYEAALAQAQQVMKDDTLSEDEQSVVDNAEIKLRKAKENLEKKKTDNQGSGGNTNNGDSNNGNSNNNGSNMNNSGNSNNNGDSHNKVVKTGDNTVVGIWTAVLGISFILTLVAVSQMLRRRKK